MQGIISSSAIALTFLESLMVAAALVGAPETPLLVSAFALPFGRRLSGALIGGIRETQEMLDFCGEHSITADVEVIPIQMVNEA